MPTYTVQRCAELAGVTVRTLHHYDHIGLLHPSERSAAGYRLYTDADLMRLQDILFYRELDVPLRDIAPLLDAPGRRRIDILRRHRTVLAERLGRLRTLMRTIDRTITDLENDVMPADLHDLYEGFSADKAMEYEAYAEERFDPVLVGESRRRMRSMSADERRALAARGDALARSVVDLMHLVVDNGRVQERMQRWHAWIECYYPCAPEVFEGLGRLYADHPDFRLRYEALAPGLADYLCEAMAVYADRMRHGPERADG